MVLNLSVCPKCQEEVPDNKIYSCEVCGKDMCPECLNKHMNKHKKMKLIELFETKKMDYQMNYDSLTVTYFIENHKSDTIEDIIEDIDYITEGFEQLKKDLLRITKKS